MFRLWVLFEGPIRWEIKATGAKEAVSSIAAACEKAHLIWQIVKVDEVYK